MMTKSKLLGLGVIVAIVLGVGLPQIGLSQDSLLKEKMDAVGSGFRTIARQLRGGEFDEESLEAVELIQVSLIESILLVPAKVEAIEDEAAKRAEVLAYREAIWATVQQAIDLERLLSVDEVDAAAVAAALTELDEARKAGHSRFKGESKF